MATRNATALRATIERLLASDPSRSDRAVAKDAGCAHGYVGRIRHELEEAGAIPTRAAMAAAAEAAARKLARSGPIGCSACGLRGTRARGAAVPNGWSANPVRCTECTAAGRFGAPVRVRHVDTSAEAPRVSSRRPRWVHDGPGTPVLARPTSRDRWSADDA